MPGCKGKILAVVGPTASGKTKLSVELAKLFNGEIVSADSMQIYKGMDIGTAKPSKTELSMVKHYLIDFLDPKENFSVAQYVKLASNCIEEIFSKGRLPIVCGGTGLYVDSLLNNITFQDSKIDYDLRSTLLEKGNRLGGQVLLDELSRFDPKIAMTLHPNNLKRIVRAIEIFYTTGKTMSEQIEESRKVESPYDCLFIGLTFENRSILYDRINDRVDQMINKGLLQEVTKILKSGIDITAISAIGYKEIQGYLLGNYSLDFAIELIKKNTRHYAKRQLTWFNRNKSINWIYVDHYESFNDVLISAKEIFNDRG